MELIVGLVEVVLVRLRAFYLTADFVVNLGAVLGFLALALTGERLARQDTSRYFGRGAATDAFYTLFYLGGFYGFLVGAPIGRLTRGLVNGSVPFLPLDFLAGLPGLLQALVAFLALDLARYWLHRWTHTNRVLWAFHQIHHSQASLTALTNYRFHFVDHALHGLVIVMVSLVLGPPGAPWLVVGLAFTWLTLLAHSGYRWGFGVLDAVLVSPRYHAIHHSIEPEHANRNFGMIFSLWDHLFGTVAVDARPPRAFGIPEPRPPESFFRQLPAPFVALLRQRRLRRATA